MQIQRPTISRIGAPPLRQRERRAHTTQAAAPARGTAEASIAPQTDLAKRERNANGIATGGHSENANQTRQQAPTQPNAETRATRSKTQSAQAKSETAETHS